MEGQGTILVGRCVARAAHRSLTKPEEIKAREDKNLVNKTILECKTFAGVSPASLCTVLGQVTLKPKDGVLWAHPTLNTKGLTEVSPLPLIVVAGARCVMFLRYREEFA